MTEVQTVTNRDTDSGRSTDSSKERYRQAVQTERGGQRQLDRASKGVGGCRR